MRDDKSEAAGRLSNDDGSLDVLHVHWSDKSHRDYSVLAAVGSYHVPSK